MLKHTWLNTENQQATYILTSGTITTLYFFLPDVFNSLVTLRYIPCVSVQFPNCNQQIEKAVAILSYTILQS